MARKIYTEDQKKEAIAKASEIGAYKAAKESGVSFGTLKTWIKATVKEPNNVPEVKKESTQKPSILSVSKQESLIAEKATLLNENKQLKKEVENLKKALMEIIQ